MNDLNGNPFFSSIKNIYLKNPDGNLLNISRQNPQCQFERLELSESVYELMPKGALIVRDTIDIISFIDKNNINDVRLEFADGTYTDLGISSITHITNAASDTEENFISINLSNKLYKFMQSSAMLDLLPYSSPQVYKVSDFVDFVSSYLGVTLGIPVATKVDETSNYIVYKPINTFEDRNEYASTNILQYLNYLSSYATDSYYTKPRYMFWTDWNNQLVMKYFADNPNLDVNGYDSTITDKNYRYAIYDSDVPIVKLPSQNNKYFKKIYFMTTDPADQFISKNYFYIRKTPKILDYTPVGATLAYTVSSLMYQFQDEGQKYNIELVSSNKSNAMVLGADQLTYDNHWGYYNYKLHPNPKSNLALIGDDFGTSPLYAGLTFGGITGYFQYVDNIEMWKMMFDFTEIHPNYPDSDLFTDTSILGNRTNLQKILDIRYNTFQENLKENNDRLETLRKIERENFVMYVLCCISKQERSFFAKLTKYEQDTTYGNGLYKGGNCADISRFGGISGATYIPYRYNWVKLNFNANYGDTGPNGSLGSGGTAYFFHNIEAWKEDPLIKGSATQDNTWAINLNERSIGNSYLPPGWIANLPENFKWRPIGAITKSGEFNGASGDIRHIVKMNVVPVSDLLLDSRQLVPSNYIGQYIYYFTAENVVDGSCNSATGAP